MLEREVAGQRRNTGNFSNNIDIGRKIIQFPDLRISDNSQSVSEAFLPLHSFTDITRDTIPETAHLATIIVFCRATLADVGGKYT